MPRSTSPSQRLRLCFRLVLVLAIATFPSPATSAQKALWVVVAERPDHQGRVEVNTQTIDRKASIVEAWLRFTEPQPGPIDSNLSSFTRFTSTLTEADCSAKTLRFKRKLYLSSPDAKVPIGQRGPYEAFKPMPGSPLAQALAYLCPP